MRLLIGLLMCLLMVLPVAAQDEGPAVICTADDVESLTDTWERGKELIEAALASGDVEEIFTMFVMIDEIFDMVRQDCNPLAWSGSGDLAIDPVFVEAGVYRLVLTGDVNTSVEAEVLSGECRGAFAYVDMDQTETQEIYRSSGCLVLWALDANADWTLTLEKVS